MLSSVQHLICTWFQKDIESLPQDVVAYQDDLSLRVASTEKVLCHLDKEASCCVVPRTSQYAESTREPRTLVASGKYNLFTELVHGIVITTDSIQSDWPNI